MPLYPYKLSATWSVIRSIHQYSFFRRQISCRRCQFLDLIFPQRQFSCKDSFSIYSSHAGFYKCSCWHCNYRGIPDDPFSTYCIIHNIGVNILCHIQPKDCSVKRHFIFFILLLYLDLQPLALIFVLHTLNIKIYRLLLRCDLEFLHFLIEHKSISGNSLHDLILSYIKVGRISPAISVRMDRRHHISFFVDQILLHIRLIQQKQILRYLLGINIFCSNDLEAGTFHRRILINKFKSGHSIGLFHRPCSCKLFSMLVQP